MLEQVRATIQKYQMFAPGDRVLVGVSGGPDSVALVHALHNLAEALQIEVFAAHLNHSLRKRESDEDAEFVGTLAENLGLTAVIKKRDIACYALQHKLSAQAAAREVRYRFFAETAKRLKCNKLATGHNANDQAETVLFHFLRGSGLAGLGGIPPVRDGWITRPLIEIPRARIEEYCKENGLKTRLDRSNLKSVYTRNKLRLELIPLLEREYNPNLVETLGRTSEIMRDEENYLEGLTAEFWTQTCLKEEPDQAIFGLDRFLALPTVWQRRIIRRAWVNLAGTEQNLGFGHLTNAIDLLKTGSTGSGLNLPMSIRLSKSYGQFTLSRSVDDKENLTYTYELKIPGLTQLPERGEAILTEIREEGLDFSAKPGRDEIMIDFDLVNLPLIVRNRKPGDWFQPCGFEGSKKLKKFFIDSKIPQRERESIPVLVNGDDRIIWVVGLRADQRWQVSRQTKMALSLKLIRSVQETNV